MIPLGGYADNSVCDWRAGVSFFILVALFCLGMYVVMHICVWAFPECGVYLGFAIPILAVLVNGQMGMRREER